MKYIRIFIFILFAAFVYGCKKDLGNYSYSPPSEPVVTKFTDSTFNALVGDSLILKPTVKIADADPLKDLSYLWEITVSEEARTVSITGYPLKMIYNLSPGLRSAKLTVTDNRNGLKYFYPFKILGGTQFSTGKTVLSVQNGVTMLSFIKPDDKTVLSNLYFTLHGENLPANPVQLYAKPLAYQPNTVDDYWVVCQDPTKNSVIINGSTMLRKKYFNEQFFSPPATIVPSYFEGASGWPTGVINNKLYISITSTAPYAPDFGKFSNPQAGDYTLSKYFTHTANFYFGFDTKYKAFVSFDGGGNYMGSDYTVVGSAFDPKNIGMADLVFMQAVSGTSYAYFRDASETIYELAFTLSMDDYSARKILPTYKRVFKGSALVQADSKWQRSAVDIFYFTSNDKIYRYNPINEDLRTLDANFGGKKVTMLKLSVDGNTLTAGVDGSVITLDVSVGKNGVITQTINGIPGTPVDIVIRK
ncbi:PKD-like family lipoprotein [Mucilaginibacter paludis]|uniref:PKD domain containing protein n=1 Tax=Mucilaginibacter paludis DSM 18603 TaxID=714943 RepID=H1Y2L6_9SPHI|nr:PKD-like family lipoprotein [Mucilaginibacter paludis]EHQ28064.1 hypothetical protein Mucpa_3973 [Mucilaginibacter paludis DSM 18603]